jgi:large subunit ribosomal protein L9
MQIILVKDMDTLGSAHEVVKVRPGYARNYLIPNKYAIEASPSNLKIVAERNKVKDLRKKQVCYREINKVVDVSKRISNYCWC